MRRALVILAATMMFGCAIVTAGVGAMMPFDQADPVLWRWLPHAEDLFEPWRRRLAVTTSARNEMFEVPIRSNPLYDPAHRRVLYYQGCCAWRETVLASVDSAPPRRLATADLLSRTTSRGVTLGMPVSAVRRAYGAAPLHRATRDPSTWELSYFRPIPSGHNSCAWYENFLFRRGRLVEIQAGSGC